MSSKERNELDKGNFGLPKQRKYPLNDKNHIMKAIQFFKYCPEEDRKELATNIMKAAKKQGIEIKSSNILDYIDE